MATTMTVRTFEYDDEGRVVRETTVVESVGPYASGGVVTMNTAPDAKAIWEALVRFKRQRGGEGLGLG